MHYNTLVYKFIYHEDNSAHVANQTLSLELVFENFVKTLVDAVKYLA